MIFFQEVTPDDTDIASNYGIKVMGSKSNIGILDAFITLVEQCSTKYFIFCENDFLLLDDNYDISKTMQDVCQILERDPYAQVKLSNYKNPGFLYLSGDSDWLQRDQSGFQYKVESLSWIPNHREFYPDVGVLDYNYEWFQFESKDQLWSNHIYACNTEYLQNVVVPLLKHNRDHNEVLDVKYQGLEDTLNFTEQIPNVTAHISDLITKHKMRKIYSGGGNFYHNKPIA